MRPSPLAATVIGAVALSLVAHLWMSPAHHREPEPHTADTAASIRAPEAPLGHTDGCASAMSACRVSMPQAGLDLVIVLALAGWFLRRISVDAETPDAISPASQERAPPRPAVPASVVLLE
ncbi:MAG: hypothetical protein R3320_03355 [Nitriliruptorales bacterium]|nr:hypothetical protein [Nitriliruptorales bacterium]